VGLWPWRNGITRAGNSITVEPDGLVQCARVSASDRSTKLEWTTGPFGTEAWELVHLPLRELGRIAAAPASVTVRRPSLLDLTSVFPPVASFRQPYQPDSDQVMRRARQYHPRIRGMTESMPRHLQILGDPSRSPVAVFGLPAGNDALLKRCLAFERFRTSPLDVVVVDLTRTSLNDIGDGWPKALEKLIAALDVSAATRPGLVLLTEDVFVSKKAEDVLRESALTSRSRRAPLERRGLLLRVPGFLEPARLPVASLTPIQFRADLKDTKLLAMRDDVLRSARTLEEHGDRDAAAALRGGFSFVRSIANMPIGLNETCRIIEVMFDTEDDADRRVRRKFFPADALLPLAEQSRASSAGPQLDNVRRKFLATVEQWGSATPISTKLAEMAAKVCGPETMLTLPDRYVATVYNLSDAAQANHWQVADPKRMLEVAKTHDCQHWVLVRPNADVLRAVLTAQPGPKFVDLVGDAAGSALLGMELRPLATLDAFAMVHERASALFKAIGRSGANPERDLEELTARSSLMSEELDFTQSEGGYTGPKVRITTEQGYVLVYRPASEVLQHTPDDLRAFLRTDARTVQPEEAILVLTKTLMETLRRELARARATVETLRQYHAAVAERRLSLPGLSCTEKARYVLRKMQGSQPDFGDHEVNNISRWLDVDGITVDNPGARPQAPTYGQCLVALNRASANWFCRSLCNSDAGNHRD
jgi:hypothetical protein